MRKSPAVLLGLSCAALLACAWGGSTGAAPPSSPPGTLLPTGHTITPTAAPGSTFQPLKPGLADNPDYAVGQAMSEALSPDGKTLLILTSGYNLVKNAAAKVIPAESTEWVFVYDVSGAAPVQKQALPVPNSFAGIAFAPDGSRFYVSGGKDDSVHSFALGGGQWAESGTPIKLGHSNGNGLGKSQAPVAAGLAVTADGKRLVVANLENDSISLLDLGSGSVAAELDLRPGRNGGAPGTPGGTYPYGVAIAGNDIAYVSSQRDREIEVVDLSGATPQLKTRIPVPGNPNKMLLNHAQTRLYVAADNADAVSVIDTAGNTLLRTLPTSFAAGEREDGDDGDAAEHGHHGERRFRGAAPNSLALSPDESTLYVTNGGTNSVAVLRLGREGREREEGESGLAGLIPTGWYPQAVAASGDGGTLYVVNSKSLPGPNPHYCKDGGPTCIAGSQVAWQPGQYILQLEKAGFQTVPVPDRATLAALTARVALNDGFARHGHERDAELMAQLRRRIKHVIYIVKENRTYDQVLGDLGSGNGDPGLVEFGAALTPNQHAIASHFVDLDNFHDSGEVSGNGWAWSTAARESDYGVKTIPLNYSGRGAGYDTEGENRNINIALPTVAARQAANPNVPADPDLLAGTANVAATDGPEGEVQQGYLWNSALRAGLSVRNYGFFCDLNRYSAAAGAAQIPEDRTPYAHGLTVTYASDPALVPLTDPYYRAYDNAFPDFYREQEWEREFAQFVRGGKLPALSLVRLMHDHTGSYATALDGINTPQADVADNDYAVGKLLETLSKSPYARDTLVFVLEDDAQDGPDHVDAHRSIGFVAGPYVKQGAVVSTHYSTVNMLRTIEDLLGIEHLSVYDAYQPPMSEVFDLDQVRWSFTAQVPSIIAPCASGQTAGCSQLPIDPTTARLGPAAPAQLHDARWWAQRTEGLDFSAEDRLDAEDYNRLLWEGIKGPLPYPEVRSGTDLRRNRQQLLKKAKLRELALAGVQ
jgi:DNA-binding beta-propeller fold protein YncE